jgi:hypothetical protein
VKIQNVYGQLVPQCSSKFAQSVGRNIYSRHNEKAGDIKEGKKMRLETGIKKFWHQLCIHSANIC